MAAAVTNVSVQPVYAAQMSFVGGSNKKCSVSNEYYVKLI